MVHRIACQTAQYFVPKEKGTKATKGEAETSPDKKKLMDRRLLKISLRRNAKERPQYMHKAHDISDPTHPILSQDIARWFEKNWDSTGEGKHNVKANLGVKRKHRNAKLVLTFTHVPDQNHERPATGTQNAMYPSYQHASRTRPTTNAYETAAGEPTLSEIDDD